jgi:ATP-dependent DNA helicase RecQ
VDLEGHGALKLTDACRPVLRGEERLMLRREVKPEKKSKKAAVRTRTVPVGNVDATLWEALRARRLQLARAQGVPPYVVFHDATLTAMAERRPRTLGEFAEISGVGERKLAAYGEEFIAVIRAHLERGTEEVMNVAD